MTPNEQTHTMVETKMGLVAQLVVNIDRLLSEKPFLNSKELDMMTFPFGKPVRSNRPSVREKFQKANS